MFLIYSVVFSIAVVAPNFNTVQAMKDVEKVAILAAVLPHVDECSKDHSITDANVRTILDTGKLSDVNNCFIACIFKSIEVFDGKGMFDVHKTLDFAKQWFTEDDMKLVPDTLHKCVHVNEQDVSDGEMGCDRARLFFECASDFTASLFPGM